MRSPTTLFEEPQRRPQEPPILDCRGIEEGAIIDGREILQGISSQRSWDNTIMDMMDMVIEGQLMANYIHVAAAKRSEAEYCENEETRAFYAALQEELSIDAHEFVQEVDWRVRGPWRTPNWETQAQNSDSREYRVLRESKPMYYYSIVPTNPSHALETAIDIYAS